MQVSTIPADIAAQAAIINRSVGALRAWTFLVQQGVGHHQVFEFLADKEGPECTQLPFPRNESGLRHPIEKVWANADAKIRAHSQEAKEIDHER